MEHQKDDELINPNPNNWMYGKLTCGYCEGHSRGWCGTGMCPVEQDGSWTD